MQGRKIDPFRRHRTGHQLDQALFDPVGRFGDLGKPERCGRASHGVCQSAQRDQAIVAIARVVQPGKKLLHHS